MRRSLFKCFIVLTVVMLMGYGFTAYAADDVVEKTDKGNINWTKGVVQAVGIGAPPEKYYGKPQARPLALRAAEVVARRNLLESIQGVRIDSSTTIVNFMTQSDIIKTEITGMVRGAKVVNQEYFSDGTVEVTVEMPLQGDFAEMVIPRKIETSNLVVPDVEPDKHREHTTGNMAQSAPVGNLTEKETEPPAPADSEEKIESNVITGLVVNAQGIGLRPAMAPKILDESGQEIFSIANVNREYAVKMGMTGYEKDLDIATQNPRVTNVPMVIKGIRCEGPGRTDVVITSDDAQRLRAIPDHISVLNKCRVMIVLD